MTIGVLRRSPWLCAVIVLVAACDLGRHEITDNGTDDATQQFTSACSSTCHGSEGEAAPPRDTSGRDDTSAIGVGAHRAHIGSSGMHKRIECATCHQVPQEIGAPGHVDTSLPAELTFRGIAEGSQWNRDVATCTNNYCHGATLTNSIGGTTGPTGGLATEPVWTTVDGSQSQCQSCHGYPPPAPHPQNPDCGTCHPTMNPGQDRVIAYAELHVDGRLDVVETAPCDSCHGANGQSAPPKDSNGGTATTLRGVGAHAAHLVTSSTWHASLTCTECHRVPAGTNDQGHIDTALPAEITFGPLAGAGTWNGTACSNTYCHALSGGLPPNQATAGGSAMSPLWTKVDGTQSQCGSCHGAPPPPPHPVDSDCGSCHQTMTAGDNVTITYPALHINGRVDVTTDRPCDSCHGSNGNPAPPLDTTGGMTTDLRSVGAHRNHLDPSTWRRTIACSDCHRVPEAMIEIGHIDTVLPAELTFGVLAGGATWNTSTCANSYCHGSTLSGGTSTNPRWTNVNGSQGQCGSCHGAPPPPPHPVQDDCGQCHDTMTAGFGLVITDPARHIDGNLDVNTSQACNTCHGSTASNAPPKDTLGNLVTAARGVGAHQAHLATTNRFAAIACNDCHRVPGSVTSLGHIDTALPAELTFSTRSGTTTQWNGSRCSNSYCHGSTLGAGGSTTAPTWTLVNGSQAQCTSCHGNPPPLPHPQSSDCGQCHADMMPGSPTTFSDPAKHVDGNVDVTSNIACNSCHGSTNNAPPKDTTGNTLTTARGVGAHQAHVATGTTWRKDIDCEQCHAVPSVVDAIGHIDTAVPAELTWSGLATGSTWNGTTCTSYCHGDTLTGGAVLAPQWTKVDGTQKQCGSCHGDPPPLPHPQNTDCGMCHDDVMAGSPTTFADRTRHIDGILDVTLNVACDKCHGSATNSAPPKDIAGNMATTVRGVGAHQKHVLASTWRKAMTCDQCHKVPTAIDDQGHFDTNLPAELTWTGIATGSTWSGTTCTSYCHGATLGGGGAKTPLWTKVDGTQSQCSSCHGAPPPPPHPVQTDCGQCHDTMTAGGGMVITAPARHIDGNLDVTASQACNACHGSMTSNAPPQDTAGNTATTTRGVGAHQSHLVPAVNRFKPVACTDCHKVPASLNATGHVDTALPAELTFSQLAGTPTWNGTACSNSYCHGSTLTGGAAKTPVWTTVNGSQAQCASCHGNPPPLPHPQVTDCGQCHNDVQVGTPTTFTAPLRHVDGTLDVSSNVPCNACHGSATNDAPPKDTAGNTATTARGVGAHQRHLVATNRFKAIACTDCHRVPGTLNAAGHVDSALPAELVFSTRSGTTTAWNGTRCSNNYCHGSTLAAGGTATAPLWTTVDGTQGTCASCHGNPPPAPHPQNSDCGQCHNDVVIGNPTSFSAPARHIDNNLDVSTSCSSCHGGTTNAGPPKATNGATATTTRGVGAHQAHLATTSTWHQVTTCAQCHKVPTVVDAVGHRDTALPAELTWTGIATGSTWNGTTCTSYCHGTTLAAGGTATSPQWTKVDGTQNQCTSCHGNPPPAPHPQNTNCTTCHPNGGTGGTFTTPAQHIDGALQVTSIHPAGYGAREMHGYEVDTKGVSTCAVSGCHGTTLGGSTGPSCDSCHNAWRTTCTFCHGGTGTTTGAPPQGVLGQTAATDRHVGAHATHGAATAMHGAWDCTMCHTKPSNALTAGHLGTGTMQAEVIYGTLNPAATYSTTTAACTNLYCHGNGRTAAGTATWTSTTTLTCTSCHLSPNPGAVATAMSGEHDKHIRDVKMQCNGCHQTVVNATRGIVAPALHVNGLKDVKMPVGTWTPATKACSGLPGGCHGTKTW